MKNLSIFHTGPITHLDHLAPIAFLLEKPLIVSSTQAQEALKKYYPMVEGIYIPLDEMTLEFLSSFDVICSCGKFWALELIDAIDTLYGKKIRSVFIPHGYSDKEKMLNRPVSQDIALVYNKQSPHLPSAHAHIEIGNLRLWFYHQFQRHFDRVVDETALFHPKDHKKTILYAPTWSSKGSNTSFFSSIDCVISSLNNAFKIIVKPHPLLEENDPARFYYLLSKYAEKVEFLLDFPPIYPLLERIDIYLGDSSSIGYDFLTYRRPLFFLKDPIEGCGELFCGSIKGEENGITQETRERKLTEAFGLMHTKKDYPKNVREELKALLFT